MSDLILGLGLIGTGMFLIILARKAWISPAANAIGKKFLTEESGINLSQGMGGDQSGRLTDDKRLSMESTRNL